MPGLSFGGREAWQADVRGQMSEVRCQMSDVRGQRARRELTADYADTTDELFDLCRVIFVPVADGGYDRHVAGVGGFVGRDE
jgi:hypothetical protein